MRRITAYCSGASNPVELLALIKCNAPIGMTLNRIRSGPLHLAIEYARSGGGFLMDSGELQNHRIGIETNFEHVLDFYSEITDRCCGNIVLIAPDAIDDQEKTIKRIKTHRTRIHYLRKNGAKIIASIKRGNLSLANSYRETASILGDDFIVGIPSNKAAISHQEISEFICAVQPEKIHFLGMTPLNDSWPLKSSMLSLISPGTEISMDGAFIRTLAGKDSGKNRISDISDELVDLGFDGIGPLSEFEITDYIGYMYDWIDDQETEPMAANGPEFERKIKEGMDFHQAAIKYGMNYYEALEDIRSKAGKKSSPIARYEHLLAEIPKVMRLIDNQPQCHVQRYLQFN